MNERSLAIGSMTALQPKCSIWRVSSKKWRKPHCRWASWSRSFTKIWRRCIRNGNFGSGKPICWRRNIKEKKRKWHTSSATGADSLTTNYLLLNRSIDSVVEKLQAELEQLDRVVLEHQMRLNTAKVSVLKTEKDVSLVISNFGKKR